MIRPVGLPTEAKKALVELKKEGLVIRSLGKEDSLRLVELDARSHNSVINENVASRGKTYRQALINLLKNNSKKEITIEYPDLDIRVTKMPDYDFLKWKTYGGYKSTESGASYEKVLSDGKKVTIIPRRNWCDTAPVKIIDINPKNQEEYRVFPSGDVMHSWNDEAGKYHREDFIPTKLGQTLSKALRVIVEPFKSNDEKELLDVTLNLKGKSFGNTVVHS